MFEIQNEKLIVNIYGYIPDYTYNENTGYYELINTPDMLMNGINQAKQKTDLKECEVNISSFGGNFIYGVEMHNILKSCGLKVTTINKGFAYSAGLHIFLAGDELCAEELSHFLFHTVSSMAWGTVYEIEEQLKIVRQYNELAKKAVKIRNPKMTDGDLDNLFNEKDQTFFPEKMKEMGLLDKIITKTKVEGIMKFTEMFFGGGKPINPEDVKNLANENLNLNNEITSLKAELDKFKNEAQSNEQVLKAKAKAEAEKAEAEKAEAEKTKAALEAEIATLKAEKEQLLNKVETLEKRVPTNNGFSSPTEPPKVQVDAYVPSYKKDLENLLQQKGHPLYNLKQ